MAKFKVGDKVKVKGSTKIGTISRINTNFGFDYYWIDGLSDGKNPPVYGEGLLSLANSSTNPVVQNAIENKCVNQTVANAFNAGVVKSDLNRLISLCKQAEIVYTKLRTVRDKSKYRLPPKDEDLERITATAKGALSKIGSVVVNGKKANGEYDKAKKEYSSLASNINNLCKKIQDESVDNLDWSENRQFLDFTRDLSDFGWSLVNSLRSLDMSAQQYREMMHEPDVD